MKIAILTSGILPVPAVQGGAVENLIDYYLEYNDRHRLHDITVYSIAPPSHYPPRAESGCTHYHYVDVSSLWHRLKRACFVRTHREGHYNPYIEYFFHECLKHLKRQPYDAVILENRPGYALPLSRVTDAQIIVHLHNDFMNSQSKDAQDIARVCHTVITVSDYIRQRVLTISPAGHLRTLTVHNGIDLTRFYQARPIDRRTLGFSKSDFIIVYSGRINPEKGVGELIQAFRSLQDLPDAKLLIIGGSFFGNEAGADPFITSLQTEAEDIASRITFTGFVPYDQIPACLKMADLAVIPSMWDDPFPTTVLEAMAAGLPIVATDSGGIREACAECAVIVERPDVVAPLASAIRRLHDSPQQRAEMSRKGLDISRLYAKERYAEEFFHAISE